MGEWMGGCTYLFIPHVALGGAEQIIYKSLGLLNRRLGNTKTLSTYHSITYMKIHCDKSLPTQPFYIITLFVTAPLHVELEEKHVVCYIIL